MLLRFSDFRRRVQEDLGALILELKEATHRYGFEEEQAWRASLPAVAAAFSDRAFDVLELLVGNMRNLSLEYRLPGGGGWADLVFLGKHRGKNAVVIVELKNWVTKGALPGPGEGLMERHGRVEGHPSDQVRGYVEWCQQCHSEVIDGRAAVHGCVIFTLDIHYHSFELAPNNRLTAAHPCFSTDRRDCSDRLPAFFRDRLTESDRDFAEAFERGAYRQSRGFVRQIGAQILDPNTSPFVLIDNQREAFALVRARVNEVVVRRGARKAVIVVEGPPGSGKSAVAANVWAALVTDPELPRGNVVVTTTSASQNSNWKHLFSKASESRGARAMAIGATGYSPVTTGEFGRLRKRYPDAFKEAQDWRHNLRMLRSLLPEFRSGARDDEFLVSIVDEAHALINPEHVEGRGQHGFAGAFGPQAYHIIRSSQVSVFLTDFRQGFRDQENTTLDDLRNWAGELGVDRFEMINLAGSQFRCAGSKEYVDWMESFLGLAERAESESAERRSASFEPAAAETAQAHYGNTLAGVFSSKFPLEVGLFENPVQLEAALRTKWSQGNSVRLLSSYSRKWKTAKMANPHSMPPHLMDFHEAVIVDEEQTHWSKVWNYVPDGMDYTHFVQAPLGSIMHGDPLSEVGCPYTVRGFDFDYVGILWLGDLKWRTDHWEVNPEQVFETGIKRLVSAAKRPDPSGQALKNLLRQVQETYRILLSRPLKGIYLWCEDLETRQHLAAALGISFADR